jgi:hypothetical protein
MEHLALEADLYVTVPSAEDEVIEDRSGVIHRISYVSVDPPEQVIFECLQMIGAAWEDYFPDEAHLAHAAGGFWLRFWTSPQIEFMSKLAAEGRSDDLRAAAKDYVLSGFGQRRGPAILIEDTAQHES